MMVCELRLHPWQRRTSDMNKVLKAEEKNRMADGIISSCKVKQDDYIEVARNWREEEIICYFKKSCFCAVVRAQVRLKWFN